MKIEKDKVVTLTYVLRTEGFDGQEVEQATAEEPLRFIFGNGTMMASFEKNLEGKQSGDEFRFKLTADEAYGQPDSANIVDILMEAFVVDGVLQKDLLVVGNYIPLQDKEGNQFYGRITNIGEQTVTLDFNHPMAGKDLFFTGKVIDVRDATKEELEHGHVH